MLLITQLASELRLPDWGRNPIVEAIADGAEEWVIEPLVNPDGEKGFVIMPRSGEDAAGPTLILWEAGPSLRLDETRWDAYRTLGLYTAADAWVEIKRRTSIPTGIVCPS